MDDAADDEVELNVNAATAAFNLADPSVPDVADGNALEDCDEDAGDGEGDDKVQAGFEQAAELDDGEDAVHKVDAGVGSEVSQGEFGEGRVETHMEYLTHDMQRM